MTSPTKGREAKDISALTALDELLDGFDAVEVFRRQIVHAKFHIERLHQLRHDRDDIQRVDQAVVDEGFSFSKSMPGQISVRISMICFLIVSKLLYPSLSTTDCHPSG